MLLILFPQGFQKLSAVEAYIKSRLYLGKDEFTYHNMPQCSGSVSGTGEGGDRFDPWPCHTKGFKNCSNDFSSLPESGLRS